MKKHITNFFLLFAVLFLSLFTCADHSEAMKVTYKPTGLYKTVVPDKISNFAVNSLPKKVEAAYKKKNKYKKLKSEDKVEYYNKVGNADKICEKFKNIKNTDSVVLTWPFAVYDPVYYDECLNYFFIVEDSGGPFTVAEVSVDPSAQKKMKELFFLLQMTGI